MASGSGSSSLLSSEAEKTRFAVTTMTRAKLKTPARNQIERLSLPTAIRRAARTAARTTLLTALPVQDEPFTAFFTLRLKEPSLFHASRRSSHVACLVRYANH